MWKGAELQEAMCGKGGTVVTTKRASHEGQRTSTKAGARGVAMQVTSNQKKVQECQAKHHPRSSNAKPKEGG